MYNGRLSLFMSTSVFLAMYLLCYVYMRYPMITYKAALKLNDLSL